MGLEWNFLSRTRFMKGVSWAQDLVTRYVPKNVVTEYMYGPQGALELQCYVCVFYMGDAGSHIVLQL